MDSESDQCEETIEDKAKAGDNRLRDTSETRDYGKFIQQLLDDTKITNLKLTGIREKFEDCMNGTKILLYRNRSQNLLKYGERLRHTDK